MGGHTISLKHIATWITNADVSFFDASQMFNPSCLGIKLSFIIFNRRHISHKLYVC